MKSILKAVPTLALAASVAWAAEPLRLQWGTIDTASDASQAESRALRATVAGKAAAARRTAAAESRAAYVVQFPGPVLEEWRTWLESATQVRGYLPEFAYLVWATPSEMLAVAANENVFWTGDPVRREVLSPAATLLPPGAQPGAFASALADALSSSSASLPDRLAFVRTRYDAALMASAYATLFDSLLASPPG